MSAPRRSVSVLTSLALALAAALLSGVPAQAAGQKSFKDWSAVCDNLNTCVAFAWPKDDGEIAWLRLERKGDAGAPVIATLAVYAEDDPDVGGGPWFLDVDGKPLPGLGALYPSQDGIGYWRMEIPAANTRALAIAARDGAELKLTRRKKAPLILSLAGGGATMIWIDEQQGRLGSPTALGRATGRPSAIVAPATPTLAAGPAVSQTGLPDKVPEAAMAAAGECERPDDRPAEALIARLSPGVVLYAPVCSSGAYNALYSLVLADERGQGGRRIDLPLPAGFGLASIGDPMNLDYDPATRTLTSFSKGRGLGDCGDETHWVWNGNAFQVLLARVMGDCKGVPFDDWPTLYQAEVR
jgi:hypothetical protein